MENLLSGPLNFSIEVGKSYISLDELVNLDIDQYFSVNKYAGEAFFLKVNNEIICTGEVIIINKFFGFRINNIHNKSQSNELTSHIDTVDEMLPIEIRFDDFQASIEDLIGISEGSIIHLDKLYNEDIDAKLLVLGKPVAEGRTVVINENFGIQIKKLLIKKIGNKKSKLIRNSGNKINFFNNTIKHYNYKRPDKFTWDFIKRIELLHQSFLNNLTQYVEINTKEIKIKVDQMTISEFISEIKEEQFIHFIYKQLFLKIVHPTKKKTKHKLLLESKYIKNKFPNNFRKIVKYYKGRSYHSKIFISLNKILKLNKNNKELNDIFLNILINTWLQVTSVQIESDIVSQFNKDIEIVPANDMILIVDIYNKENQIIRIVYPYITIEPLIQILK